MKLPNNLIDKIEDGILSLDSVPTSTLLDWLEQTDDYQVMDVIGCEIMYRDDCYEQV
jgi:type II secretory pathway component PulM